MLSRVTILKFSAILVAAILFLSAAAGCSAFAKPGVVGVWNAPAAAGKAGSLPDLTLRADGSFTHAGLNGLRVGVTFLGTYEVTSLGGAPVLRLTYNDFPSKPSILYYTVDAKTLTVAVTKQALAQGAGEVYERR